MSYELYIPPVRKQKKRNTKITKEQENYIVAHINDRPRVAVMRKANVSIASFYRIVREHGGELDYSRSTRNKALEKFIIENFARMSTDEIMQKTGAPRKRINVIAKEHNLKHDPDVQARLDHAQRVNLDKARKKRNLSKQGEKRSMLFRMEELRVMSGQKQLTRLRISRMPVRHRQAAWHLRNKYNYIWDIDDPWNIYYDKETHRVRTEDLYRRKYKFNILPADE